MYIINIERYVPIVSDISIIYIYIQYFEEDTYRNVISLVLFLVFLLPA